MNKKIDYQNLPSNIMKDLEITTDDNDGESPTKGADDLTRFFRKTKRKIFGFAFKLHFMVIIGRWEKADIF